MSKFYVAFELGVERGRVMLGTLDKEKLTVSEVRHFKNRPLNEDRSLHWNIPQLYQESLAGLQDIAKYNEPVEGVSCTAWAGDYLLFSADGSLIGPTYHHHDSRTADGMKQVLKKIPWETIYEETGVQKVPTTTLFQFGAESRRLKKAAHFLPIADGFNYLMCGVPKAEMSSASMTQLFNPTTGTWSERVINEFKLPSKVFPELVPPGTKLGPLHANIAGKTALEDAQVIASCSHDMAAALAGLPVGFGENWAYLRLNGSADMGIQVPKPLINDVAREWNFTNDVCYGGVRRFSKQVAGLSILQECQRQWAEKEHEIDGDMLLHLAIAAEPFESLVNFSDPRFLTPGDLPEKIQAYCRETKQAVPRKPGPIARCVLQSLALLYRKTFEELKYLTGREVTHLYILGQPTNSLLNNFIANALGVTVVMAPPDSIAMGNVVAQALALGHIKSLHDARELMRNSVRLETILSRGNLWDPVYARYAELLSPTVECAQAAGS